MGERWREFLWQNMIGGIYPMMDLILSRFAQDRQLGIVFPDDPHLPSWDLNRELAERLAEQMGVKRLLTPFFNFPVGTMFWVRTAALAPLFKLKLDWSDYPREPALIDGTILHALERLLPFIARHEGYRYATTYIPGISW
jgi:lipopolysaccharide biosynthesis protein